jgi:uncharacterized protein (TIGR02147 family)
MPAVDIYGFTDFRRFLAEWFEARKQANPRLSHRWFARKVGTSDPSVLSNIVSGRRNLTDERVARFAEALDLDEAESRYFSALVTYGQADDDTRQRALAQLRALRAQHRPPIGDDATEYYRSHRYTAVRELAACRGFRPDAAWIAAQFDPPWSEEEAQEAVDLLLRLGMIREQEGHWLAQDKDLATDAKVLEWASVRYHQETDALARGALERIRELQHETFFVGQTLSIPSARIPDLQARIWEAFHSVATEVDSWSAPDRVVQLNLRMFPLTRAPDVDPSD